MFRKKSDKPLTARQKAVREAKQTHNKYAQLYAEDKKRRQHERGETGAWTDAYPLKKAPDPLQRLVDPIVNNKIFQGIIFVLIVYSIYNLFSSYAAENPVELDGVQSQGFIISIIFMLEFGLKFASRRWAYVRREGIVDFLAASDIFSPAIRATKFVRFLRVLRVLRMVRGVRMVNKGSTHIEDNLFTTFTTATIVAMLGFIAVYSITSWGERKSRAHEGLITVLQQAEGALDFNANGEISSEASKKKAEIILARQQGFLSASFRKGSSFISSKTPNWIFGVQKQVHGPSMVKAGKDAEAVLKGKSSQLSLTDRIFLENQVLSLFKEDATIDDYNKISNTLYYQKQEASVGPYLTVLEDIERILKREVKIITTPISTEKSLKDYAKNELSKKYFEDEFLTVRRSIPDAGTMEYQFIISDEYRQSRSDEMWMIVATFVLIIVMVLALNYAVNGIVQPITELHGRMLEMSQSGKFVPIRFSTPPDNEFADIADNINAVIKRLLVGTSGSIDTFR